MGAPSPPPVPPPAPERCPFCGAALDPHQAVRGGVCDAAECRRRLAVRHATARAPGPQNRRYARLAALREEILAADPAEERARLPLVVLPASTREVVPLPAERREAFAAHLRAVIDRVFAAVERGDAPAPAAREALRTVDPADRPFLAAACGLCRGYCCRLGHDAHAYLDEATIAGYVFEHPEASREEVRQAYLARLPEESFAPGCVYQGERGCTLPEGMRAPVCGWFLCDGLIELLDVLDAGGPRRALLVADGEATRAAVLDEAGLHPRPVPPRPRPAGEYPP